MRLKVLACCSASLAALALYAAPAAAQTPEPEPQAQETPAGQEPEAAETEDTVVDEVVVTGIRRSLQSAQGIRRNSDQIVDAVVAEDIGKLPDLNTAQTASRIPGVQVYRQGGEAQNVLVRGLPNFTTTYNGREIFTAETRIVALQDFPSANIAALEVFKTSSANLVEPGLAGLVNIRSRRPFDFAEGQFAGSVWGLYTEQGDAVTPNFNFLATKRWDLAAGGEFGLLLNVSRTDMRYLDAEISNTDFLQTFARQGDVLVSDPRSGQAARFPDVQRLFYRSGKRERPSVNAAAQYRPRPDLEFYGEFLWQGFRNEIDDRLLAAELFNGASFSSLRFRDGGNLVAGGTVNAPPGSLFSFQGATLNETDTFQYAAGFRYSPDRLTLNVEIARTDSTFTGSTESVDRRWIDGPTINFDTNEPKFEITNIDLGDPSEQFFDGLYEQNQRSAGDDLQVRGDLEYDLDRPLIRSVQLGLRYTDRSAERRFSDRFGRSANLVNARDLPLTFEVFEGVDAVGGTTRWAAPTYDSIRDNLGALRTLVGFGAGPVPAALLYTAEEENLAGYGQVNLGGGDIEGAVGVRVTHVETRVAGPAPTGIPAIDDGGSETSVLPNASVRARVNETIQLRAAVSKTRTLPGFADLNPALVLGAPPPGGVGTPSDPYRANGGNPFLEPFTSWNLDAAAEFFYGPGSFVSLTVFHRELDGFIQQNTFRVEDPRLGVVEITGPVNTGEGRISGVELQGQTFFDSERLPDWARGFGVQGNLTYLDAETQQPNGPGANAPLAFQPITGDPARQQSPGVSRWQYNLVGIYERYGFSARLTYSGQSEFRATRQFRTGGDFGQFNDTYTEVAYPAPRLDLSLNYEISDQFTVFGDWTNITQNTFEQDFTSARNGARPAEFVRYKRFDESTLSLGLRFRFGS